MKLLINKMEEQMFEHNVFGKFFIFCYFCVTFFKRTTNQESIMHHIRIEITYTKRIEKKKNFFFCFLNNLTFSKRVMLDIYIWRNRKKYS